MPMNPGAVERGRLDPAALASLRAAMQIRIEALRAEISSALRQSGDPESMRLANHLDETDDEAVADLETGTEIAAIERDAKELAALEAARRRLDSGEYGDCRDCGSAIPLERLRIEPAAERCVGCQSRFEQRHAVLRGGRL
jgi:RNA polymerase-binding protein DksA